MTGRMMSAAQRVETFNRYVMPEPNSGCWLWIGAASKHGYGNFRVGYKQVKAHRFSYELHKGRACRARKWLKTPARSRRMAARQNRA